MAETIPQRAPPSLPLLPIPKSATWALVLGIIGLITSVILIGLLIAPVAIVLGIIAWTKIGGAPTQFGGKGRAIAGIALGVATFVLLPVTITIIAVLASLAVPVYNGVTVKAEQAKALANAKSIVLACRAYAADYGGMAPDSLADLEEDYPGLPVGEGGEAPLQYLLAPGTNFDELAPDTEVLRQVFSDGKTIVVTADGAGSIRPRGP